jgi:hypothetical protein
MSTGGRWQSGRSRGRLLLGKKLVVLGAVVAVMASSVSIISPVLSSEDGKRVTLRLADRTSDDDRVTEEIDVDDNGFPTVGDYAVVTRDPMFNRALTERVGFARAQIMLVQVNKDGPVAFEDDYTFEFEDGFITAEGTDLLAKPTVTLAVTGGTGAYETARGTLTLDFSNENRTLFTFKLIL